MINVEVNQNVLFEEAKLTDIEGIKNLLIQLVPEQNPEYGLMLVDLSESIKSDYNKWFILKQNGALLGCCQLIMYSNLVRSPFRKAIIDSVIIDENFQNNGLGKFLIKNVIEYAKVNRVGKVQLISSFKRNFAHEFYDCIGFKKMGYGFIIDLFH